MGKGLTDSRRNDNIKTYQRMLEERFYLYRPWIPICKSIEAKVIGNLELSPPVLDIGCGNGLFATYCFRNKIDVGLDYDVRAIKEARERGAYERLELADASSLPFKDNAFQTVLSVCVIEHIPDLDKVLSGVYRVLKRNGKFIFTVPSENFANLLFTSRLLRILGLKGLARRYGDEKNRRSTHLHIYAPSRWKEILKDRGFDIESIDYIFPGEAVLLWSFFHTLPFKLLFLPFELFRNFNVRGVDNLLRFLLNSLLSDWTDKRSRRYSSNGGYLLIETRKR